MRGRLLGFAFAFGMMSGCLTPGGDRPALDQAVGRASGPFIEVMVDAGLGVVRAAERGALAIWASAPEITVRLRFAAGAADTWTVTLDNCLPDAVITVTTKAGAIVAAAASPGEVPTAQRLQITRGGESDLVVHLHPKDADDLSPFRFALLSDIQEAIDRVQDIYARMNQDPSIRFVLSAGDLTQHGTHEHFVRYQKEMRQLNVPCYATLGNHDIETADGIYQKYFGRGSYRFKYRGVQFTLLDSASASIDPAVDQELTGWLAEGRDHVHVVATHIPPLDPVGERNLSFASRNEAGALLEKLAEAKVDLTLYGHIHAYYTFENAGIPAFVSGGGGAHPETMDGLGRHYMTVDLGAGGVIETSVVRID